MSRHYKAEDVEREIERLLRFRDENDFDLGIKHGIETVKSVLKDLPTIEAGEDCISREYLKSFEYINKGDFNSVETIREWIDTAPSVIPKAKEGEWIDKGEYAECSLCGAHSGTQYDGVEPIPLKTKYCPDCGKKMKGADNE